MDGNLVSISDAKEKRLKETTSGRFVRSYMDGNLVSISDAKEKRLKETASGRYVRSYESISFSGDKDNLQTYFPRQGSINQAERIKEIATNRLAKLRASVSSSGDEDNTNLQAYFPRQGPISQAEKIKEIATKRLAILRASISSSADEVNTNLQAYSPRQGHFSQADRIKKAAAERLVKLRASISSSEDGKEDNSNSRSSLLRHAQVGEAKSVKAVVEGQSNLREHFSSSENEEEDCPILISISESQSHVSGSPSFTKVNNDIHPVVNFGMNNLVYNSNQVCEKSNHNTTSIRRSDTSSRSESEAPWLNKVLPFKRVDVGNPMPSTSDDINLPSCSKSQDFRKSSHEIVTLSSDECILEFSIPESNVSSCNKRRDQQEFISFSQSIKSNLWENFLFHLLDIQRNANLWDLFNYDDVKIFNEFNALCMESQTIYINLLNNEYTWYRESSLSYPEISQQIKPFIDTLIEKQFFITDVSEAGIEELVQLMSQQELKDVCRISGLRNDGKRQILAKSLIEFSKSHRIMHQVDGQDVKKFIEEEILKILGRVFKVNYVPRELFLRTEILYALPLARSMTIDGRIPLLNIMERVSSGKVTFPNYTLEPLQKLFTSRESLKRFQCALHLEATIKEKIKRKDYDEVVHLHDSAVIQFLEELKNTQTSEEVASLPCFLRAFTSGTVLARAIHCSLECLRAKRMYTKMLLAYDNLLSQDLYLRNFKGIWFDQMAQFYQQTMKDISKTVVFLIEALTDPSLTFLDRLCLSDRGSQIVNLKKRNKTEAKNHQELREMLVCLKGIQEVLIQARCITGKIGKESQISYIYETDEGIGQMLSTVEDVIKVHFKQSGYSHGVHAVHSIGLSIFGIFFWDVIYGAKVPNVFLFPYQTYPLDLKSGDFYTNRESLIKTRVAQIKDLWNEKEMKDHVQKIWTEEEGKESIVSWKIFQDLNQFQAMVKCIGRIIISKICEKMAKEFHILWKGFPCMILWNQTTKRCKFIQVKAPNAELTPSQKSWLLYLSTAGGDAIACCVGTVGGKSVKRKAEVADDYDPLDLDDTMELGYC